MDNISQRGLHAHGDWAIHQPLSKSNLQLVLQKEQGLKGPLRVLEIVTNQTFFVPIFISEYIRAPG